MRLFAFLSLSIALTVSIAGAQVIRELPPTTAFRAVSTGQSVAASGVAVGYTDQSHIAQPALWRLSGSSYVREALPLPPGNSYGAANSIGPSGAIAGYLQPPDQSTATATLWTAPPGGAYAATPLPTPIGSTLTGAYSINATDSVGGFRETASGNTNGVVWDPVIGSAYTAMVLPSLSGWVDSAATTINDNGDLAGYSFAALGGPRGAVWEKTPSGYVARDVISAADDVVITGMNNFGTGAAVVNGDEAGVMVFYEGDYYVGELNVPFGSSDSAANAVNNNDVIVGYVQDPTTLQGGNEAALWMPGDDEWELINLDDWLNRTAPPSLASWILMEAFGVTDNGLVVGLGVRGGVERGFVLDVSSLVPEPTSATLALLAGPMLLVRRRRRRR